MGALSAVSRELSRATRAERLRARAKASSVRPMCWRAYFLRRAPLGQAVVAPAWAVSGFARVWNQSGAQQAALGPIALHAYFNVLLYAASASLPAGSSA